MNPAYKVNKGIAFLKLPYFIVSASGAGTFTVCGSREEANKERIKWKNHGYSKTYIKKKYGYTQLTDY